VAHLGGKKKKEGVGKKTSGGKGAKGRRIGEKSNEGGKREEVLSSVRKQKRNKASGENGRKPSFKELIWKGTTQSRGRDIY